MDVRPQASEARAFAAAGECGLRIDRPAAEIDAAHFTDRPVTFEHEAHRIESIVAGGAASIGAMARHRLAEREIAELRFIARDHWHFRQAAEEFARQEFAEPPSCRVSRGSCAGPANSS